MSEKLSIAVEDARFYAYHGVFAQETIVGNEFEVSVKVDLLLPKSIKDDNLSETISYVDLYEIISEEMKIPSKLIEHVAYRIVGRIRDRWLMVEHGFVSIKKLAPPIDNFMGSAKVVINF